MGEGRSAQIGRSCVRQANWSGAACAAFLVLSLSAPGWSSTPAPAASPLPPATPTPSMPPASPHPSPSIVVPAGASSPVAIPLAAGAPTAEGQMPYDKFTDGATSQTGLFTVWRKQGQVYFELTPQQLD